MASRPLTFATQNTMKIVRETVAGSLKPNIHGRFNPSPRLSSCAPSAIRVDVTGPGSRVSEFSFTN